MVGNCRQRPELMKRCEVMVKLLCHASALKGDDIKLRRSTFNERSCTLCQLASYDNAIHMIMQCPAHEQVRIEMYNCINRIRHELDQSCGLDVLLGKQIEGWDFEDMLPIWHISCSFIYTMYNTRIRRYKR